jgi:excinuclease ABC subunit C
MKYRDHFMPNKPGVYLIKDRSGRIIYVGKAISLVKRVKAHFRLDSKLAAHISDVDYIVTSNELEALILEANLIKKHKPKFNVLLRDDKQYPYLKLTMNEEWPRLLIVRKVLDDGAKYFGPYRSQTVNDIIKTVKRLFQIRWCRVIKKRNQPCFYYHMGKCLAPCAKRVSKDQYLKSVRDIELFLEGKYDIAIGKLKREMQDASRNKEYELAARVRDKIRLFERMYEEQKVVTADKKDRDVFSVQTYGSSALVLKLEIMSGKIMGKESYFIKSIKLKEEDVLMNSIMQYYSGATYIPEEVVTDIDEKDRKLMEGALTKLKGSKVAVKLPKSGIYMGLYRMAQENSRFMMEQRLKAESDIHSSLLDLKRMLGIERVPFRIEAFDISTTMGVETVGSMVVFEDGAPLKADYRKFKIKWTKGLPAGRQGMNDVAGISEIVKRRYSGVLSREMPLPDLVLIDGGVPQLNAARRSAPKGIAIAALAKKLEEVYMPGWKNPLRLDKNIPALKLLRRIRDEAHRFAVAFHRKRRTTRMLS